VEKARENPKKIVEKKGHEGVLQNPNHQPCKGEGLMEFLAKLNPSETGGIETTMFIGSPLAEKVVGLGGVTIGKKGELRAKAPRLTTKTKKQRA